MKFVLLDIIDSKTKINKKQYKLSEDKIINEIELSKEALINITNLYFKKSISIIDKIRIKLYELKLKKYITFKQDNEVYFLLANNINQTNSYITYLFKILSKYNVKMFEYKTEMEINLAKYIEEYILNNQLDELNLKLLFVYKDVKNIDLDLILEMLNKHKKANIYLKEMPNKELLDKIDKINDKEGCIIEVIKYNKKAFIDYDVVYYADDYKENYPRMRLNKKALVIDNQTSQTDKFNSNIIFFNKIENKTIQIDCLKNKYGLLPFAIMLRQL